jgi:hypothetical protein
MAKLAANVSVRNPETGEQETLAAGTDAPDWAVPLIRNPKAWEGNPPKAATTGGDDTKSTRTKQ